MSQPQNSTNMRQVPDFGDLRFFGRREKKYEDKEDNNKRTDNW
jgi:hypothetical protein